MRNRTTDASGRTIGRPTEKEDGNKLVGDRQKKYEKREKRWEKSGRFLVELGENGTALGWLGNCLRLKIDYMREDYGADIPLLS